MDHNGFSAQPLWFRNVENPLPHLSVCVKWDHQFRSAPSTECPYKYTQKGFEIFVFRTNCTNIKVFILPGDFSIIISLLNLTNEMSDVLLLGYHLLLSQQEQGRYQK